MYALTQLSLLSVCTEYTVQGDKNGGIHVGSEQSIFRAQRAPQVGDREFSAQSSQLFGHDQERAEEAQSMVQQEPGVEAGRRHSGEDDDQPRSIHGGSPLTNTTSPAAPPGLSTMLAGERLGEKSSVLS